MADRLTTQNGNQTSVASSASSVTLLAAKSDRYAFSIFNDSTQVLFVLAANTVAGAAATAASNANYTVQIAAGGFYESQSPYGYAGPIFGIWAAANGNARVTEYS